MKRSGICREEVQFQQGFGMADPRPGEGRPGPELRGSGGRNAGAAAGDAAVGGLHGERAASGRGVHTPGADRPDDAGAGSARPAGSRTVNEPGQKTSRSDYR